MKNEIFDSMLSQYDLTTEQNKKNAIFEVNQQIILAGLYAGGWVIEPDVEYGIWHGVVDGLLFVGNYIRSWFVDVPYKAEIYTTGYNIAYWFIAISEVMQSLRFVFRFTRH